jgi:hypothetical protein
LNPWPNSGSEFKAKLWNESSAVQTKAEQSALTAAKFGTLTGRSMNHFSKGSQNFRIAIGVVGFGISLVLPQADANRILAAWI